MGETILIATVVPVDVDELWENVVGGESGYWASRYTDLDGGKLNWYNEVGTPVGREFRPNPQPFRVCEYDEATGEKTWHTVAVTELAEAYLKLKHDGWTHCGGCPVDDTDACTGDAILQNAVFGEFIYG